MNVSKLNDNQLEPTITVDPDNPDNLFAASVTVHGTMAGTFG